MRGFGSPGSRREHPHRAQRPSWPGIGRCGSQGAGHCRCWNSVWREAFWGHGDVADARCAGSTALACRCQHDSRRLAQARSLTAGPGSGPPGPDRGLGRPEPSRQQAVGGLAGDGLDRLENLPGRPDAATARRTPRSTTAAPAAALSLLWPPLPPAFAPSLGRPVSSLDPPPPGRAAARAPRTSPRRRKDGAGTMRSGGCQPHGCDPAHVGVTSPQLRGAVRASPLPHDRWPSSERIFTVACLHLSTARAAGRKPWPRPSSACRLGLASPPPGPFRPWHPSPDIRAGPVPGGPALRGCQPDPNPENFILTLFLKSLSQNFTLTTILTP